MEPWRKVWRDGLAPVLSTAGLRALRQALVSDDPRLQQGQTTTPPPLESVLDWPCDGACLIGLCGWLGDGLETVGEVEEFFAKACHACDERLREPAGIRHLLDWYDDTPRDEMRRELLVEVDLTLGERLMPGAAPAAVIETAWGDV